MKQFFKKIFSKPVTPSETKEVPQGWRLTFSDLFDELKSGKRKQIGEQELDWADQYERSLIPKNYRYPRKGDLYKANVDQEVDFITFWSAPYSGGGRATIFKGEEIWIDKQSQKEHPTSVYALPVNYIEIESRIIPEADRSAFKYDGYCLSVSTMVLTEKFELIKTGFTKDKYS